MYEKDIPQNVCAECPIKEFCEQIRKPFGVLDLSRDDAEVLYDSFDIARTRSYNISMIDGCKRANGINCLMSAQHQTRFVQMFIDNENYDDESI
jgi:hypothetical protein